MQSQLRCQRCLVFCVSGGSSCIASVASLRRHEARFYSLHPEAKRSALPEPWDGQMTPQTELGGIGGQRWRALRRRSGGGAGIGSFSLLAEEGVVVTQTTRCSSDGCACSEGEK